METEIKRTYWGNGQLCSEYPCADGTPHGVWKWWYRNGQLRSEQSYVGGVLHGVERWWYPNGQLRLEESYVDGKPHGMVKWWDPDGSIVWFLLYNKGEAVAKLYPQNETHKWKLK
jgi:antitoxin component YwqK of YwqJK toxin-antitoxin module